ncbi:MAG TPA: biopolymer transporter ExbD, partial [Terriglobia bacterium]|nr:biopolymer transporter ExbD [Terriglobia bacterium]
ASMMPFLASGSPEATPSAQELRVGISVELAVTRNAAPMPDADQPGSSILSVTRNGGVFLGIKPIRSAALAESIKAGRSRKIGNKVYIKADARTRYANVAKVLDAVRTAGDESAVVLLTGQRGTPNPGTPNPGTPLPPYGLVAQMGVPSGNGSRATVLQLLDSGRLSPQLQINDQPIPWIDLQSSLRRVLPKSKNKVVLVKADGSLPYADVVRLIDACHSLGARAHLETRGR